MRTPHSTYRTRRKQQKVHVNDLQWDLPRKMIVIQNNGITVVGGIFKELLNNRQVGVCSNNVIIYSDS